MRLTARRRAATALVCALLYGAATGAATPAAAGPLPPAAVEALREARAGDMTKLAIHGEPRAMPDVPLVLAEGGDASLADWRGKLVVVNLWATWCGPCRTEMPSLAALKAELAPEGIAVIAINTERKGAVKAPRFFAREGIAGLEPLVEPTGELPRRLGVIGYPVTLILGPEGQELARMQGEADWHSPEALALLRRFAAEIARSGEDS